MVRCPRCGSVADGLHQLPRGALPNDAPGGSPDAAETKACRWCIHEITEG